MSLRLAFDLDGVLADMEGELVRQAETLFGKAVTRRLAAGSRPALPAELNGLPADIKERDRESTADGAAEPPAAAVVADAALPVVGLHMTARQTRRLWRHVETIENFWESLEEIEPGVIARLAAVAAERRWEIIFLTRRPESAGLTAQVQTQRWLESKGFALPSVYVVQGSRGRIAAALHLDFVVDDRPENCLDVVVDSKARAILVWREDEKQLPAGARRLGIGVVKTLDECLNILAQVDAQPSGKARVMDRVMRLLGLKEPVKA
jgi:hypothetical protein